MKKLNGGIVMIVVVIATIVAIGFWSSHSKTKERPEVVPVKISIGVITQPPAALIMVAKDKGFFTEQGLDVELKEFTAGKLALQALLAGSLDFSISADVPVALAALQGNKIVVPAQVIKQATNTIRIVARKDGNITDAKEYFISKKRKLATSIGGGPELFTYQFLNKLGVDKNRVEIISQQPQDMPAALANGSVDAIAIFDPAAYIAETQMGDKGITFTDSSIYSEKYILDAPESVKQNSNNLEKVLRALIEAEQYVKNNPDEAKNIVSKYTKLDKPALDKFWSNYDFQVVLTKQLADSFNQEVQWAKDTGKESSSTLNPDFSQIIYGIPLQKISSAAVEL
ncbi:MAG: ABC transporter substrate-binding protein [Patescibacteria group bacterium]